MWSQVASHQYAIHLTDFVILLLNSISENSPVITVAPNRVIKHSDVIEDILQARVDR
jgi:hypothetical protein